MRLNKWLKAVAEMKIAAYSDQYKKKVENLIVSIQRNEFAVQITAEDQPDLQKIPSFYQQGNGNFWLAIQDEAVVGTIAALDIGKQELALRKMFVHVEWRGKYKGVAQQLLDGLINWSHDKKIRSIYLGTIDRMKAAHRFYEKNGFLRIEKKDLPPAFPVMAVDNVFYQLLINTSS